MGKPRLAHNGLFSPAERGIYWLRLYRVSERDSIAVLTEVPGNPGMSVTNAASMLSRDLAETFANQEELDIL